MSHPKPSIGIIGAGPVGRGIAALLDRAGYAVAVGTRHPEAARRHGLPEGVDVGTLQHAARADVVVMTTRHPAAPAVLSLLRRELTGKVLIDTMNAWIFRDYVAAGLSDSLTEGSWLARQVPECMVARAFSHIDCDVLVSRPVAEPGRWAVAYAADAEPAARIAERLITDTGYVPVRVGTLAESAPLDVGGVLWPYMFTPGDMRDVLATSLAR